MTLYKHIYVADQNSILIEPIEVQWDGTNYYPTEGDTELPLCIPGDSLGVIKSDSVFPAVAERLYAIFAQVDMDLFIDKVVADNTRRIAELQNCIESVTQMNEAITGLHS